jgi:hypothetical protein
MNITYETGSLWLVGCTYKIYLNALSSLPLFTQWQNAIVHIFTKFKTISWLVILYLAFIDRSKARGYFTLIRTWVMLIMEDAIVLWSLEQ